MKSWSVIKYNIKHCTVTNMDEEKFRNQWKSHEFLNFDDMTHKWAWLYLASMDSMSMLQIAYSSWTL